MQEVFAENAEASQVVYVFVRKVQIFNIFDYLLHARHD